MSIVEGLACQDVMTLYGVMELVNIGSGNGLLPDGTKPLPEPRLTKLYSFIRKIQIP